MNHQPKSHDCCALEEEYRQKMEEYRTAEESGIAKEQLISIYKELKHISYQLAVIRPRSYYQNMSSE